MIKDKISIITTFYNTEEYILQCIHSVNSQIIPDDLDVEYILVDDCSTDKTLDLINAYFDKVKNERIEVKIIKLTNNIGVGGAKDFGIKNSTGNYIMFLDSDDYYINSDFIYRAHKDIKENDADIVEYGFMTRNKDTYVIELYKSPKSLIIENNKIGNMQLMFTEFAIRFVVWNKIIKRSIIESCPYSHSRTFDDIETTPLWVYNANKILIKNSIEINYRCVFNSILRNNTLDSKYETIKAMSKLFEIFKDDINILKMIYERCLYDMESIVNGSSDDEYFRKMSKLNTYMLKYIYPDKYKDITYDVE